MAELCLGIDTAHAYGTEEIILGNNFLSGKNTESVNCSGYIK
jgi:hypothetical protein